MNISRVTKAIAQIRGDKKFQDAENIRNIDVDLVIPTDADAYIFQMAQTAAALLLRCFTGTVRIHGSTGNNLELLKARVYQEAEKLGAIHRLDFAPLNLSRWRLAFGCRADGAICGDVSGWSARINNLFEKRLPAASPTITFAVACMVAKLFNAALFGKDKHLFESWDFCLLRMISGEREPVGVQAKVDLGRVGLLGAGAIGSALGYVLLFSDWVADLQVIDFDVFEDPNLETCILARQKDVNVPLQKAQSLANAFAGHSIKATHRKGEITKDHPILSEQWNAFVCAVDNSETRRILDSTNTEVLLNAGLGSSKEDAGFVLWTRHKHGMPTLSELYKATNGDSPTNDAVPEEFQECSRIAYLGVSLSMPFAALVAGSLLGASLYRHAIGATNAVRYMQMDLFGIQRFMRRLS